MKYPTITFNMPQDMGLKSGFLRELLESVEQLNHKYYEEKFDDDCNTVQVIVKVNGKIAISEKYGVKK